jgi:GNAT superfamily N-acetyltransferase
VSHQLIALPPSAREPALVCDRGVSLITTADRQLHAPDQTLLLVDGASLLARCSCWWSGTAQHRGQQVGVIGHYAAASRDAGVAMLAAATDLLGSQGLALAVGPMDGTTWRRYRFIVERGSEPVFFLEPDNPDEWPGHWADAGFTPLATYGSAINADLRRHDARTQGAISGLTARGVRIRMLDVSRRDAELRRIHALSLAAFSGNFLYTPIGEEEFLAQYRAVLPYVRPELVLMAEQQDVLLGYLFALPDITQAQRGDPVDTVILKTLAVDPSARGLGLGGALMDLAQRSARELGFRRAIHALIHDANVSGRISARSGRTMRKYALFARTLSV